MKFPALSQLANAVWSMVAVGTRTVEVNTKTGFALTAGSYAPIKSIQRGTYAIAGEEAFVSTLIAAVVIAKTVTNVLSVAAYDTGTGAAIGAQFQPVFSFPDTTHLRTDTASGAALGATETVKVNVEIVEYF
jgi:hypothetical protein